MVRYQILARMSKSDALQRLVAFQALSQIRHQIVVARALVVFTLGQKVALDALDRLAFG